MTGSAAGAATETRIATEQWGIGIRANARVITTGICGQGTLPESACHMKGSGACNRLGNCTERMKQALPAWDMLTLCG